MTSAQQVFSVCTFNFMFLFARLQSNMRSLDTQSPEKRLLKRHHRAPPADVYYQDLK